MNDKYIQKRKEEWRKRRQEYLVAFIICGIFSCYIYSTRNKIVTTDALINLGSMTLREAPTIKKQAGKNGGHYIQLLFAEVNRPLQVPGTSYNCTDKDALVNSFGRGDTLQVLVDKKDYHAYTGFEGENVYGLIANGRNYCDLACSRKEYYHNQLEGTFDFGWLSIGCLIACLLPGKPFIRVSKYTTYDIEPLAVILGLLIVVYLVYYLFK